MKITKTKLKQIIKEELSAVLSEKDSSSEILGVHDIRNSRVFIDAVRKKMKEFVEDDPRIPIIRGWIDRKIRKEEDEDLRAELVALRDEVLSAGGDVDREGRTGPERRRQRRQHYRDEAEGEAAPAGRMTTRQSLGLGE